MTSMEIKPEPDKKRLSRKKKLLVICGIILTLIFVNGIYQYRVGKERERRIHLTVLKIRKDGNVKIDGKNRKPSIIIDKACYYLPIPYSVARKFPTDFILSSIEVQNKKCTPYIMGLDTDIMDLEEAILINSGINDQNSSFIKKHNKLIELNLSKNEIGDLTLAHLHEFRSLKELDLSNTRITDTGIIEAMKSGAFNQLQILNLGNAYITGKGIMKGVKSGSFNQLKSINLNNANIGDETLKQLSKLPKLETLSLNWTSITDQGLKYLANNQSIRTLELSEADISDQSIEVLLSLDNLISLDLSETKISAEGITRLRKKYPWLYYKKPLSQQVSR
jgi:Leucine Rich repeat